MMSFLTRPKYSVGGRVYKNTGGRIGYEKGLLVSDLTEQELVNAQSAARKQGITGKKGSKEDHRKDLMKIIHYAIIQLHVHDLGKK